MQTGSRDRIMATRFSRMLSVQRPALVSRRVFVDSLVRLNPLRLVANPVMLIEKSGTVPIDAQVLEGIAMVDESLLTGESTAVRKAPGDDVIGGSQVLSDTLTAKVTVNPDETFINQMIRMVESSKRPKTPNEQAV